MSNNYAPCFPRIDFVVIPSSIHMFYQSICVPTFASSDRPKPVFVIGYATNVMNMPRKFMPVK